MMLIGRTAFSSSYEGWRRASNCCQIFLPSQDAVLLIEIAPRLSSFLPCRSLCYSASRSHLMDTKILNIRERVESRKFELVCRRFVLVDKYVAFIPKGSDTKRTNGWPASFTCSFGVIAVSTWHVRRPHLFSKIYFEWFLFEIFKFSSCCWWGAARVPQIGR